MFGLKKCKEEDFFQFTYSNIKYKPRDFYGYLVVLLISIGIFVGMELVYYYYSGIDVHNKNIINNIVIAFILITILLIGMTMIKNKKYAYKFQKYLVLILDQLIIVK